MTATMRDILEASYQRRTAQPEADLWGLIITEVDPFRRTAAEIASGVTPTNYAYLPGNVLRYGADPTGVADSTTAFNNAILIAPNGRSNQRVFVPVGTYNVTNIEVVNGMWIEGECHGAGANAGSAATVLEGRHKRRGRIPSQH
jgi:hypothetical protein